MAELSRGRSAQFLMAMFQGSGTISPILAIAEPEYQEKVRHNITLAGGGSQIFSLDPALALDAVDADWERLVT